jgi:hypothetical protein
MFGFAPLQVFARVTLPKGSSIVPNYFVTFSELDDYLCRLVLARLIESSDFMSFRELALKCLEIKGYRGIAVTDGWRDGGTDVRVFHMPPNPTPLAFQISVEKDWRSKAKADAVKVKDNLKLEHMILVSSRRIAEAEFQIIADEIWREQAVRVTRIDNQSIASTFFAEGRSGEVLSILGINITGQTSGRDQTARSDAAMAFVFFGKMCPVFVRPLSNLVLLL